MTTHSRRLFLVTAILFVFIAWRFLAIPTLYMREDEQLSFRAIELNSIPEVLEYQTTQDNQAPLWYVIFWLWSQLTGYTEFSARIMSILFSALSAAFVYQVGRRWFDDWRVGALGVLIWMLSAFAFIGTMEIRAYSLTLVLSAASMIALHRWLERPTVRRALIYGASTAFLLYTHYFLVFLILFQAVFALIAGKPRKTIFWQLIVAGIFGLLLWLPQLPILIGQVLMLRELAAEAGQIYGVGLGIFLAREPTNAGTIGRWIASITNGQWLLYAVLLIAAVALLYKRRGFWLAFGWGIGVPVFMLVANLFAAVYAGRYVFHPTIGLALVIAAVILALPRRAFTVAALAAFMIIGAVSFGSALPVRVPYRDLFASVNALSQPGDVAYFNRGDALDNLVAWHIREYLDPQITRVTNGDFAAAQSARRVWFVTADWFNEDVRAQFDILERTHPVRRVFGQCDRVWCYLVQWMVAPPLDEPLIFGDVLPFYGAEVDAIENAALGVRLYWRVDQPPLLDYSIALHLLNENGDLVAQDDGPILHYGVETVPTSQMQPGQIYGDVRTMTLPTEVHGTHRLAVMVYQTWDGARLLLPDGADRYVFATIDIP